MPCAWACLPAYSLNSTVYSWAVSSSLLVLQVSILTIDPWKTKNDGQLIPPDILLTNNTYGENLVTRNQWLTDVRRAHVIQPIMQDSRNTNVSNTCLGYDKKWIFFNAIGGGQANFDEPIANLSPRDRVLLYAFLNQKGHVDELSHAFGKLLPQPHNLHGATVLDIGCGPFTAGLSLANIAGNVITFRYYGVDTSTMMREVGAELAAATRNSGGLNVNSSVDFHSALDDIDFGSPRAGWTMVVLSYLLASDSLNVEALVTQLLHACKRIGLGPVAVLYTNTTREAAGAKYPELEARLLAAGFTKQVEDREMLEDGDRARPVHYALFVRLTGTPINIQVFRP